MRRAAAQVDAAARAVPELIGPGISEPQVQLEVERVLRQAGHQGQLRFRGFNQEMHYGQVLGGPSGAVPGYSDSPLCGPGPNAVLGKGPDGHVLADGDPVIVDLVGGSRGLPGRPDADVLGRPGAGRAAAGVRRGRRDPPRGGGSRCGRAACRARSSTAPSRWRPRRAWATISWATAPAGCGSWATASASRSTSCRCWPPASTLRWSPATWSPSSPSSSSPAVGAVGIENMYAVTDDGWEKITTAREELIEA